MSPAGSGACAFWSTAATASAPIPASASWSGSPARRGPGLVLYKVKDPAIARLHRLGIGTITSSSSISVKVVRGATLGHVEEGFVSRLKPGDVFFFAGRQLEFVRLRDMTALVKASTRKSRTVPAWAGGQMALSDLLSVHLRREVHRCAGAIQAADPAAASAEDHRLDTAELRALEPLLRRQADLSRLPREDQFLVEVTRSREGSHLFAYPFEGRFVHEGLGFLWAGRLTRIQSATITVSVNDYGFELLAPRGYPFEALYEDWSEALLDQSGTRSGSGGFDQPLGALPPPLPVHRPDCRPGGEWLPGAEKERRSAADQRCPALRCLQPP